MNIRILESDWYNEGKLHEALLLDVTILDNVSSISTIRSDLHRWLAAFPNPNDPNKDEEEVIYEDWGK